MKCLDDLNKNTRLNIGCGNVIKKGYGNLDFINGKNVDKVHNLNKFPYPFRDKQFKEITASHIIEHLNDLPKTMKELYRILSKGGILKITVPHFSYPSNAFHKIYFCSFDFSYFIKSANSTSKETFPMFKSCKTKIRFMKGIRFWNYAIEMAVNCSDLIRAIYEHSFAYIFPAFTIEAELMKLNKKTK